VISRFALLVVLLFGAGCSAKSPATLADAIHLASSPSKFESSRKGAETFASISRVLVRDARACTARHAPPRTCRARAEAAAVTQSAAVAVLDCTQPDVEDMRRGVLRYLTQISHVDKNARAKDPSFPKFVAC
jgi:hypothetical protein